MYAVSPFYIEATRQPTFEYTVTGVIGNQAFDESSIVEGTFHVTNQCTDSSDLNIGGVYTGTLEATFKGINIPRMEWKGKVIQFDVSLHTYGDVYESVPFQPFTIREAKHTAEGVQVVAYDSMTKLDKKFKKSHFTFNDGLGNSMYRYIQVMCADCNITCAQLGSEIAELPNGDKSFALVGSSGKLKDFATDINTYRDLCFWIAQTLGCFATIDREGKLKFVPYVNENNNVDTINDEQMLEGAAFDDFVANYNGVFFTDTKTGEDVYYGYSVAEINAEITVIEGELDDLADDLEALEEAYAQHEITEAEYKRQKKAINKQMKNLEKRVRWLLEAREHVSTEDGNYMELGENPLLQATDGDTQAEIEAARKRVLAAVCNISYTPFSCDTVFGIHYDLGDVIRFEGGHAGADGVSCCIMQFDWTLNDTYTMQGFGEDPALQMVKSRTSKSASKAEKNAVSAKESGGGGGGGGYTTAAYNDIQFVSFTEIS